MSDLRGDLAAVGVTIVIALSVCYARARDLSYATFERWSQRKSTAKTQLEDKTLQRMYALQTELNNALGEAAGGDELRFTLDPSLFQTNVLIAAKYYGLSHSIDRAYAHCRRFAGWVPRCLELTVLTAIWFFVRLSWIRPWPGWTLLLAVLPLTVAGLLLISCYLVHLHFNERLQASVVVAEGSEE